MSNSVTTKNLLDFCVDSDHVTLVGLGLRLSRPRFAVSECSRSIFIH